MVTKLLLALANCITAISESVHRQNRRLMAASNQQRKQQPATSVTFSMTKFIFSCNLRQAVVEVRAVGIPRILNVCDSSQVLTKFENMFGHTGLDSSPPYWRSESGLQTVSVRCLIHFLFR